jgi:ribose transport system ATP-binding protein
MVGADTLGDNDRKLRPAGSPALRLQNLGRDGTVHDISLTVHTGEVLGLAGLVGAGRTELLRLVCGADRAEQGSIFLGDDAEPLRLATPVDAVRAGIGFLPEDRKSQGLLLTQSVEVNTTLTDTRAISHFGLLDRVRALAAANHWAGQLRIRARDMDQAVAELSGGNQQKTLLARWLHRRCKVLLLDEPTRGVDVAARRDMYGQIDQLAAAGCALVVASSDLRELMQLCDRIAVLSAGRLAGIFTRGAWSERALLEAAFSGHIDPHTEAAA